MGAAVQLSQNSVIPGSTITARFTVKNVGMMPVLSFQVGVYLSSDAKVDQDTDMNLGSIPVSASARAPALVISQSIFAPVASTARTVAAATSGPMPSPGMSVI